MSHTDELKAKIEQLKAALIEAKFYVPPHAKSVHARIKAALGS